ncbi:MAG: polysaccharide biosynthesis protein [Clostridia bacterium]|nr:polysaccharide biosynthesis protein [Clostridia bacterium]
MNVFKHKRKLLLLSIDLAIILSAYLVTLAFILISGIGVIEGAPLRYSVAFIIFTACIYASRFLFGIYGNVWRYANAESYARCVIADFVGGTVALLITYIPPMRIFFIGAWQSLSLIAIANLLTLMSRFVYQTMYRNKNVVHGEAKKRKISVAIVGAGQVGSLLAEELIFNEKSHYTPVLFIDKEKSKIGSRILGIEIIEEGAERTSERILSAGVQEIFIALPRLKNEQVIELYKQYSETGLKVKFYDLAGMDGAHSVKEIKVEDLLCRETITVIDDATRATYRDKRVIVTGGGGSIGSELCRQIAKCSPKELIIFDIYENNAYEIQQELLRKYGDKLSLSVEIGSVRDRARLDAVFMHYRPEIVLHAAAHKHVPLMEHSNCEAIKNNCFGTYNVADMAEKWGAERFILISTDKAVNPTNIMGASKRMCEMIIQCRHDSKTKFSAVRFGNVLGSNGSVIPLFKRQIDMGGPVTITDKRIIRYFMTIPEASGLVMQAGSIAKGGDLFVLDMGKPVRIIELAENMIRLSGHTPRVDIKIVETGLRPGEKLYEELLIKSEDLDKTENNLIFIEKDAPLSREAIEEKLEILRRALAECEGEIESQGIKAAMKSVVPTFFEPEEINSKAQGAEEMLAVAK